MILPRATDINKAKTIETKRQIDEGMALARKVDLMHEMKVEQEYELMKWREITLKGIQEEINTFTAQRDTLIAEIRIAQVKRDKLNEPLLLDWNVLNEEKVKLVEEKNQLFLDRELFQKKEIALEEEVEMVQNLTRELIEEKEDTSKKKKQILKLQKAKESEYAKAQQYREKQEGIIQKRLQEAIQLKESYQVGITTNKLKEDSLTEKEAELITRERDLERRSNRVQQYVNTDRSSNIESSE